MIPFLWMLSSSFKELPQIFIYPPKWIPNPIRPENYIEALAKMNFPVALKNTLTITVLCLIGQVGSASLVAYGFARLRFPGRDFLFMLVLSTMMVPAQVTMILSLFSSAARLGGYIQAPDCTCLFRWGSIFIFLLRQFSSLFRRIRGCSADRWLQYKKDLLADNVALGKACADHSIYLFFHEPLERFYGTLIYLNSEHKGPSLLPCSHFRAVYK